MHDFSLFFLKHILPVGIAANLFLLIGVLIAKFLWGRYSKRLSNAVEENLNLTSQWITLGASQRDLFKKLRARWQADRDAWEKCLSSLEEDILAKDSRIARLTAELQSSGKSIPAALVENEPMRVELRKLNEELEARDHEIVELKEPENEEFTVSPLIPLASNADNVDEDQRIQELEQDLIDTHDELHRVREDYLKQVELVESLESRLIESDQEKSEIDLAGEAAALSANSAQFNALLARRSAELLSFRDEALVLKAQNKQLQAEVAKTKELDRVTAELNQTNSKLEEKEALLASKEKALNDAKAVQNEQAISLESLELKVEARDAELDSLRSQIAELEVLNGRRAGLQVELNDAHHEMYDVRTALNERLDEIKMLEARLVKIDLAEDEAHALSEEVKDTRHELSDVRIALNSKTEEYGKLVAQMEELEAIIEDRSAEVEDLSSEVRQQRDQIRALKNSLAEKEGELEALGEESNAYTLSMNAKESFLNAQTARIADLEQSLAERYDELNEVRRQLGNDERDTQHHKARADQLEAELERRRSEFEASDTRIGEVENEIEAAHGKIAGLTEKLSASDESITDLEEQFVTLSRDKDEALRDLDRANTRIEELDEAARERQERILELEAESREASQDAGAIQRKVDSLNVEIEEANQHREEAKANLHELEKALRASDEKTLKLSCEIEEREDAIKQYVEQQKQSVAEIEELRGKVFKRGDAIRDLQAEISSIILQRSERDKEISLLKKKLRSSEKHVDSSGSSTEPDAASFDEALQKSLLSEQSGGGVSLDDLDEEPGRDHAPAPADQAEPAEVVESGRVEAEMDEDAVYFDEGSAALTDQSLGRLDELALDLRRGGRSRASVAVITYAGAEGTSDFNESLSAKRADSVRERLLERGVPRSVITVQSSGQDRRFSDWRARRAELVLVPNAVAETVN
ncbi:MAG: OmpA family protein [Verrucomicrobiales bacterium]